MRITPGQIGRQVQHMRICTPLVTVIALILRTLRYRCMYTRVSTGTDSVPLSLRDQFENMIPCNGVLCF
jgi:hypothetical protein